MKKRIYYPQIAMIAALLVAVFCRMPYVYYTLQSAQIDVVSQLITKCDNTKRAKLGVIFICLSFAGKTVFQPVAGKYGSASALNFHPYACWRMISSS